MIRRAVRTVRRLKIVIVSVFFYSQSTVHAFPYKDTHQFKITDPDLGSCGNACCAVDCVIGQGYDPEEVFEAMKEILSDHGSDGSFTYSDGSDASGHNPSPDLRPYNLTAKFIFQGTHSTTGGYVDTLNFAINEDDQGSLSVRAFSISNIHGALGDGGQNYKTLAFLSQEIENTQGVSCQSLNIVYGCGGKK